MLEIPSTDIVIRETVVSFSEAYDAPVGSQLLEYWNRLRGERGRPTWREFNFSDIMDITPAMIIKDVIDGGQEFKNRFWGSANSEIVGFDGTGKTIADYYNPEHVAEILALFRAPLRTSTPMILRGKNYYQLKTAWRPYQAICVGFTGEDDTVSQLVIAYDE